MLWPLACSVWAEVGVGDVTNALVRMEKRQPTDWAYTQTVTTDEIESVARYDPRLPDTVLGWTMLRVNGQAPSKKEKRKFYGKIEKQAERAEKAGDTAPVLSELIRLDTLERSRALDGGYVVFSFVPKIEKLEDALDGELVFDVEHQRVSGIRVWNRGDYSPAFSVKVTDFSLDLAFGPVDSDMVLTQMVSKVKGTVGFVKKVDESVRVTFSEYELLGE